MPLRWGWVTVRYQAEALQAAMQSRVRGLGLPEGAPSWEDSLLVGILDHAHSGAVSAAQTPTASICSRYGSWKQQLDEAIEADWGCHWQVRYRTGHASHLHAIT